MDNLYCFLLQFLITLVRFQNYTPAFTGVLYVCNGSSLDCSFFIKTSQACSNVRLTFFFIQRSVPISSHMNTGMLVLFKVPSNSKMCSWHVPSLHLSQQSSNKSWGRIKPPRMRGGLKTLFLFNMPLQFCSGIPRNYRICTKYFQTLRCLFLEVKIHLIFYTKYQFFVLCSSHLYC